VCVAPRTRSQIEGAEFVVVAGVQPDDARHLAQVVDLIDGVVVGEFVEQRRSRLSGAAEGAARAFYLVTLLTFSFFFENISVFFRLVRCCFHGPPPSQTFALFSFLFFNIHLYLSSICMCWLVRRTAAAAVSSLRSPTGIKFATCIRCIHSVFFALKFIVSNHVLLRLSVCYFARLLPSTPELSDASTFSTPGKRFGVFFCSSKVKSRPIPARRNV